MSAGDTPAVLFYLLDRHALLAMTNGSKCVFLNSLTTPRRAPHDTPPPESPAQTMFARGPVWRWAFCCGAVRAYVLL